MHKKKFAHIFLIILVVVFAANFRQRQIFKKNVSPTKELGTRENIQSRRLIKRPHVVRYRSHQILVKFKPRLSVQSIHAAIQAYRTSEIAQIPLLNVYQLQIPEEMTVEEMKELTNEDIKEMLGIPLSPIRLKCAILGLKVLEGAIHQYEGGEVGSSIK